MNQPAGGSPSIVVLAGTNGAGKSSVLGAAIRERTVAGENLDYFNPDEAARALRSVNPGLGPTEANALAWSIGKQRLEDAISSQTPFAFETTLGGNTIPALLLRASARGLAVRVWYVGLNTPELHIARVRQRVAMGGHDIPEAKIRERYDRSRENLIRLLPALAELHVFDNSAAGDPATGESPRPRVILRMRDRTIVQSCAIADVPGWAKPIFIAALRTYGI